MTLHEIVSIGEAGAHEDVFTAAKDQELADTLVEFSKLAIWPTPKTLKRVYLHLYDSKLVVLHKLVVEVNVCLEPNDLWTHSELKKTVARFIELRPITSLAYGPMLDILGERTSEPPCEEVQAVGITLDQIFTEMMDLPTMLVDKKTAWSSTYL